jgi:transposase
VLCGHWCAIGKCCCEERASHIQHIQKALEQMNLKLANVLSDVTGVTGLRILRDIIAGVYDPEQLAKHRD